MPRNTKGASSRKAQEALASNLSLDSANFGNFGGGFASNIFGSSTSNGFSALSEDYTVNDTAIEFQFQKLKKKDPVTKLKALKELSIIFEQRSKSELEIILPSWVHYFNLLAVDNSRKVREAIYVCFAIILTTVKKKIIPYLEKLFPLWYLNIGDPSREVSVAAKELFHTSFASVQSRNECFSTCAQSFLSYIRSQLGHTPQTMSDMKVTSAEDAQERFDRILVSCFTALASFLSLAPPLPADLLTPLFTPLFLNYAKSIHEGTRRGVYAYLTALMMRCPEQTADATTLPMVTKVVFNAFGDNDKLNDKAQWELLLTLLAHHSACWTYVKVMLRSVFQTYI
jgi:hypothetical protein